MLSEVAHKVARAKAKARFSSDATSEAFFKAKSLSGGANNVPHVSGETIS